MVITCPKCQQEMHIADELHTHVYRCVGCQGLWFEAAETNRRLPDAETIDVGQESSGKINNTIDHYNCPVCESNYPMIRMVDADQPHIEFESCIHCNGRYYDAGEFKDTAELTLREYFFDQRKAPRD